MKTLQTTALVFLLAATASHGAVPDFAGIRPALLVEVPGTPEMEPWSEAPVWRDGEVFFSNRPFVRVTKERQVLKYLNLHVAGTFLRANGHILACEHFHRALLDIAPDDTVRIVAERDEAGEPLRGLNDVTADAEGNVYWTDPTGSGSEHPTGRIYRVTPAGRVERFADNLAFPNGLEVDPASKFLYVVESQTKKVLRYALPKAGEKLGAAEVFFDFGPDSGGGDGLCFDAAGNVWITEFSRNTGGGRVVVVSPDGNLLGEVKPEARLVTNIAFGGAANDELFVSTGGPSAIFHARAGVPGFRGHPVPELTLGRALALAPLNEAISTEPDRSRYAELRIYHALPGKVDTILEGFREPMNALKKRHGLNPLACWVSQDPSATNVVVVELLAPPSEAAAIAGWTALAADPEFAPAYAASEAKHGKAYTKIETLKLVAPANAWKLVNNGERPARVFDLRLYARVPGKEAAFRDRWRDHAIRIYERHDMDNLGWWEATDADHTGVMATLFAHESLDAINATIGAFHRDEEWIRIEKETEAGGKLRTGATAYKLTPVDFSALQ